MNNKNTQTKGLELSAAIEAVGKNCSSWRALQDREIRHTHKSYKFHGDQIENTAKEIENYMSKGERYALELVSLRHEALRFASFEQQDDNKFVLAMIDGYFASKFDFERKNEDRLLLRGIFPTNSVSARIHNELGHLTLKDVQIEINKELLVHKERHRLESVTSKPRFTFDFARKPAIVKDEPKPKMRMKI